MKKYTISTLIKLKISEAHFPLKQQTCNKDVELYIAQFTFQKILYVSPSTFQVCSLLFYDTYSLLNPQTEIKYSDTHYKTTLLTFIRSTKMGILYMLYYAFP